MRILCIGTFTPTILLPVVGLVAGIHGLIKGRRGAGGLLGISILACIVAIIVLSVIYSTPDYIIDEDVTQQEVVEEREEEEEAPDAADTSPGETDSATLGEKNALRKAESYLSFSGFSYSGLVKQLEFEGFTHEEAVYGADHCGADWNEQAALKAEQYLEYSSFSRDGLIAQLEFEGFTRQQAEYGAQAAGY